jgi:hypothetical protein
MNKKPNRKRAIGVNFYINAEEEKILNEKIKKANMSKSEYLRKQSLEKEIVVVDGLNEVALQLKKIGNNLNQIARAINSGMVGDPRGDFEKIEKLYGESLKELSQISRKKV